MGVFVEQTEFYVKSVLTKPNKYDTLSANLTLKTATGKSNRSNDVQRAAGRCEGGTHENGEWPRELRSKSRVGK
jgi:hypothetical protein